MKENTKRKMKKHHWLITLAITIVVSMWIYGMTSVYFPEPYHIGFGQYIDLGVGIVIFTLVISGFIVTAIFKRKKRK